MARRVVVAGLAASALMLAACGTDAGAPADSDTPAATQAANGSSSDPVVGQWVGKWSSNGETRQAILNIGTSNPLRATIDIPGRCGADWVESTRGGNTVNVDATVTYGACSDNRWSVVIGSTEISATDPDNSANSLRFTKQ